MTNGNNDIEELEELLTELEGQEAQLVAPYSEDDDAVTQLMDAPLGDQEWMVQVTPIDRRMMASDQLVEDLRVGKISDKTLVWRGGMDDWLPISKVDELRQALGQPAKPSKAASRELAPPPAVEPSQPSWASSPASEQDSAPPPERRLPPPPVAAAPLPPPPVARVAQTNTTRPVAVDFPEATLAQDGGLFSGKKAVLALSAVAVLAVFVTAYAFSAGDASPPEATAAAAQPQAVGSLKPVAPEASDAPGTTASSDPVAPSMAKSDESETETDDEADSSEDVEKAGRRSVPARYSMRAKSRRKKSRRSRSTSRASKKPERKVEAAPAASETLEEAMQSRAGTEESDSTAEEPAAEETVAEPTPRNTAKSGGLDRKAAKAALDRAAVQARNCRPQGGPSGTGQVQVVYEPSGRVASVSILSSKFEGTTAGSCVKMLFRRARVPEFSGSVTRVNKRFEIP